MRTKLLVKLKRCFYIIPTEPSPHRLGRCTVQCYGSEGMRQYSSWLGCTLLLYPELRGCGKVQFPINQSCVMDSLAFLVTDEID